MSETKDKDDDKKKTNTLFAQYQTLLVRYPIRMNITQSGLITSASVITSQYLLYDSSSKQSFLDSIVWKEVIVMAIVAMTLTTPCILVFYHYLSKVRMGGNLFKLFLDQFVFSPLLTASIIGYRIYLLDPSLPASVIVQQVVNITPSAMKSAWLFWIPIRFFAIIYVPQIYQILFGNACSFVWNIIFALQLSK